MNDADDAEVEIDVAFRGQREFGNSLCCKFRPASALVVLLSGVSAVSLIVSATAATCTFSANPTAWFTRRTTGPWVRVPKPLFLTVTMEVPGSYGEEWSRPPRWTRLHCCCWYRRS